MELEEFSRFKVFFLTNFLNKFEQIKTELAKKDQKLEYLSSHLANLQDNCRDKELLLNQIDNLKQKNSEMNQHLHQQKQAREELKI